MADYEASFDINPPSLDATFDLSQTTIDAVFEINPSGAQKISDLTDVKLLNLQNGQILAYDSTLNKWVNTSYVSSTKWGEITGILEDQTDLKDALDAKQETLVSGTNIKTVNNTSLLGSGNIIVTSDTFVYEQGAAATTWTIVHNLNKFPSVSVVDTAENVLTCGVKYIDRNTCEITMNGASKGKAYLN